MRSEEGACESFVAATAARCPRLRPQFRDRRLAIAVTGFWIGSRNRLLGVFLIQTDMQLQFRNPFQTLVYQALFERRLRRPITPLMNLLNPFRLVVCGNDFLQAGYAIVGARNPVKGVRCRGKRAAILACQSPDPARRIRATWEKALLVEPAFFQKR